MTTANTLLGLGAVMSAIYSFYTGTIYTIYSMALTDYRAALFIGGLGAVVVVAIWPLLSGHRIRDVHGRNFAIALIICLFVIPYVVQGQYNVGTYTPLYTPEQTVSDFTVRLSYWNTSGTWKFGSVAEADVSNGTFTATLTAAAQDTTKLARLWIDFEETTNYNASAFDSDNENHVIAVGLRVTTATEGKPLTLNMGFGGNPGDTYGHLIEQNFPIFTSDTKEYIFTIGSNVYSTIDDSLTAMLTQNTGIWLEESDASQLINAAVITIELHFYMSASLDQFYEYLLYGGIIMCGMALGMTKYWNPLKGGRYRYW